MQEGKLISCFLVSKTMKISFWLNFFVLVVVVLSGAYVAPSRALQFFSSAG